MRTTAAFLMILCLLTGCAHVIDKETLALVDQGISFRMLKQHPEAYAGKFVLLGGIIAGVRNSAAGGEIEIVQFELDSRGRPDETVSSGGRFIALSDGFLDPMIYLTGLRVSLVGSVAGSRMRPLNGVEYRYPLVSIREVKVLKPDIDSPYPMFHFGIGVGHTF